ncbi:predicted protein [Lichtheimia corymbifera JMRC:FSU:9682]|uniref:Brl1/Brr6 domain-containing protein n=1 Tax=Lichtheimia corymbifera JMRC:FSU:9682 TaxID=1263082 RepID=A0A068RFS1_9FUNG|nr:predicted protein [Lichtheimia corymbifera JMRC:FSU:9682]
MLPRKRRKTAAHDTPTAITFPRQAPLLFSNYLQLALHVLGIATLAIVIVLVFYTAQSEIDARLAQHLEALEEEKLQCSQQYHRNKCHLYTQSSLFGELCEQWQSCMNREKGSIARSKIIMTTYGELVNALVEPLTVKTMAAICVLLFSTLLGIALVN